MTEGVSQIAWHYTVGNRMTSIEEDGIIRLATAGPQFQRERAVVWLTVSDTFDPTAAKEVQERQTGEIRQLSIEETEELCGGLFRIGVAAAGLGTWEDYRKRARLPPKVLDILAEIALEKGSNPDDWRVSFDPLPRDRWLSTEVRYRGVWQPVA